MKKHSYYALALIFFVLIACRTEKTSNPELKASDGYVEVQGGKVWYGIMGEGSETPLLCLHGGPGGTSRGYYNLSEIAEERPVIMFDQLGTGRSDHHQDTTLLKPELFVEQVKAVKEALNLKDFYLMGGSWGTALALEYYTVYPEEVKGIIFSSPYFSTPVWTDDAALEYDSVTVERPPKKAACQRSSSSSSWPSTSTNARTPDPSQPGPKSSKS